MESISPRVVIVTSNYTFESLYRYGAGLLTTDDLEDDHLFQATNRRIINLELNEKLVDKARPSKSWIIACRTIRDRVI